MQDGVVKANARSIPGLYPAPTRHRRLIQWVEEIAALTKPDRVAWCDGSDEEWTRLTDELDRAGTFKRLNPAKRPNCFYAASDPSMLTAVKAGDKIKFEAKQVDGQYTVTKIEKAK